VSGRIYWEDTGKGPEASFEMSGWSISDDEGIKAFLTASLKFGETILWKHTKITPKSLTTITKKKKKKNGEWTILTDNSEYRLLAKSLKKL
jgi:hypothetical protein